MIKRRLDWHFGQQFGIFYNLFKEKIHYIKLKDLNVSLEPLGKALTFSQNLTKTPFLGYL